MDTGPEDQPQPLRLFLHIGVHKTGSTSLQLRFSENPDTLKRHGVLYPLGRFKEYPHQHSEIVAQATEARAGELQSMLSGMHDEAVASACHTVVLSGEEISLLPQKRIELLRDALRSAGFSTIVVAFFRPYVDHVRSIISEQMKIRGRFATPSGIASWLGRYEGADIAARFALVFGAENFIRHDLSEGDDSVALFDKDIGLAADLAAAWVNTRIDFATLSWLNAIKAELDLPLAVPQRLHAKHFEGRSPFTAAEAAFLAEVANAIGGEKGALLKTQSQQLHAKESGLAPIEAQLDYLMRFNRFVADLRRHMRRRAVRRRLAALFGKKPAASSGRESPGNR
ncbi:MAG: hypothetical protein ACRED5_04945 [Propylenella sp.]